MAVEKNKSTALVSNVMRRVHKVHFIGIAGAGMSGIAEVMLNLGYAVTGSDLSENSVTQRLTKQGATIYKGHQEDNIQSADVVVTSTAIPQDNPEVIAAKQKRIPVIPRAEMLAELMRFTQGIAVAGTHGKTTTTSLVASLLAEGGLDPTFVIGGRLNSIAGHARLGSGDYLVAEADESDASFLYLQPVMAIVTNIDADHLGTYEGDFSKLKQAFLEFLHHLPFYGLAILCADDEVISNLLPEITKPVLTYGIENAADVQAYDINFDGRQTKFNVRLKAHGEIKGVVLNLPGKHNILNALAAITLAVELGVEYTDIKNALTSFAGIGRRFQIHGEVNTEKGDVLFIDDYGHHPSEMQATLNAIKTGWPNRRVVVVFQPHRYSRTQDLFEDFCTVLSEIDVLCICEVYAAGEKPIAGADGRALCGAIRARGRVNPVFVEKLDNLADILRDILLADDILITLGAGDIGSCASTLPELLEVKK